MSLFGKIFQAVTEEVKLNEQESFAGIALAMAGADGNVGRGEWDEIVNYMNRLSLYDNYSGAAFDKLVDKLFRILKKEGPGSLVEKSVAALPSDLRLTAFACAVDIATSDGVLEEEEKDMINQLAELLTVPEKTAISIIEVMLIKNKV